MASLSKPPTTPPHVRPRAVPISSFPSILPLSLPLLWTARPHSRACALKTGSDGSDLLRKPVVPPPVKDFDGISEEGGDENVKEKQKGEEEVEEEEEEEEEGWVDWEDQILEDTVPLVGFVRMILHSSKYENGVRLSPEHQRTIVERLLPYHPESEKKIGCGIDYITVGYHPDFETSRCLFIVRKDGQMVDFSYWKCIKGLIRKNYPLYADTFILRHFRRRRQSG